MTAIPENPIPDDAAANRPHEPRIRVAVESWENEGGHLPPRPSAIAPSDISPVVLGQGMESGDLAAMRARFLADFAGGSMGQHHNTYQHRSRVLRQQTGERPR